MMNETLRSCWQCNPAHEHLKTAERLHCIACGRHYELGVEVGSSRSLLDLVTATPDGAALVRAIEKASQEAADRGISLDVVPLDVTMTCYPIKERP